MNLSDLASYVTTKCQQLEVDDITACKQFISKRYELIFNSYLWKDALTMVDITVDPTTDANAAAGIVLLPPQIDRVVAVRNTANAIRVHALEEYFRNDWNRFADTNDLNGLVEFSILNPIWFTCRPTTSNYTEVHYDAVYDIDYPEVPGFGKSSITVPNGYYKVTKVSANDGGILPDVISDYPIGHVEYAYISENTLLLWGVQDAVVTAKIELCNIVGNVSNSSSTILVSSDSADDLPNGATPTTVKVTWRDTQNRYTTTSTLPFTITPTDGIGFIEVESVFKNVSTGNVSLQLKTPLEETTISATVGTLLPSETKSVQYQRIRLFGKPVTSMVISVLGKKQFVPLDFDSEVPLIRNLDNCLIAFGSADLLQRARQYGKAAQQMQEGTILLQELAKLETMQAANNQRFIPEGGYGDPFFAPSSNRGVWF